MTRIDWHKVISELEALGVKVLPLILEILPLILNGSFSKLSHDQLIAWLVAAAQALTGGQPLPPLPVTP